MSTLLKTPDVQVQTQVEKLQSEIQEVRSANYALQQELSALRLEEADWCRNSWLQQKVQRQACALNSLQRRVRTQRLVLRTLNELERDLTAEEWIELRAKHADEFDSPSLYI